MVPTSFEAIPRAGNILTVEWTHNTKRQGRPDSFNQPHTLLNVINF